MITEITITSADKSSDHNVLKIQDDNDSTHCVHLIIQDDDSKNTSSIMVDISELKLALKRISAK